MKTKLLLSVVLLFVSLIVSLPAMADYCQFVMICDEEYICHYDFECYPTYGVVMTTEPNWCLYHRRDRVFYRYSGSTITGWYINEPCDISPPPNDFDPTPYRNEAACAENPLPGC